MSKVPEVQRKQKTEKEITNSAKQGSVTFSV